MVDRKFNCSDSIRGLIASGGSGAGAWVGRLAAKVGRVSDARRVMIRNVCFIMWAP